MEQYESGNHAYHSTMPTDSLINLRDGLVESKKIGFRVLEENQRKLGHLVRTRLIERGVISVAAEGFESPAVVVCYTDDPEIRTGLNLKKKVFKLQQEFL